MKKYKTIVGLAFILLSFSSCNKNYECNCTDGSLNSEVTTHNIESNTEADAREKCQSHVKTGPNGTSTCSLNL